MGVNSISSGSPHVRPMGRTCGEPDEIKKNTHPKTFTALFREQDGSDVFIQAGPQEILARSEHVTRNAPPSVVHTAIRRQFLEGPGKRVDPLDLQVQGVAKSYPPHTALNWGVNEFPCARGPRGRDGTGRDVRGGDLAATTKAC